MSDTRMWLTMAGWGILAIGFVIWAWKQVKKVDNAAESENHSWEALMEEVGREIERKYRAQGLPLSDLPDRISEDEKESAALRSPLMKEYAEEYGAFLLDSPEPPKPRFPMPPTPKDAA